MSESYISVYLRNAEEGPSCYYRIVQYTQELKDYKFKINNAFTIDEYRKNINLQFIPAKRLYQLILLVKVIYRRYRDIRYDLKNSPKCIIISREIYPRFAFSILLKQLLKLLNDYKIIWDFDDDIMAFGEISKAEKEKLEKYSDQIIVTHQYLKETLNSTCYGKIMVMPTTDKGCMKDEFIKLTANRKQLFVNQINLVWIGTSSNLKFLDIAIGALDKAAKQIKSFYKKGVILNIVCNIPYLPEKNICHLEIKNYKWERDKANKIMKISHIGIMPLRQCEIAKGKGAFKLIQYLSYGIPIIASPVGFNREVVNEQSGFLAYNDEDWKNALLKLTENFLTWEKYAFNARSNYEINFSYKNNLATWKKLIERQLENYY